MENATAACLLQTLSSNKSSSGHICAQLISLIASPIGRKFSLHAWAQQGITEDFTATGISKDLLFQTSSKWWLSEEGSIIEVFKGVTVAICGSKLKHTS